MAGIITLPSAPSTGLGQLGSVIAGAGQDWLNEKRRTDREAQLRQQQLADVDSARAYQDKLYGRGRTDQLTDEARRREQQLSDVNATALRNALIVLVHEGLLEEKWLIEADTNPEKIAAIKIAHDQAVARGLDVLYKDMIANGVLNPADTGDAEKVAVAKATWAQMQAGENAAARGRVAGKDQDLKDAAAMQTELSGRIRGINQRIAEVGAVLRKQAPDPTPREVDALAFPQNDQAKLKPAEIQARREAAYGTLKQRLDSAWMKEHEDARIERQLLSDELSNATRAFDTIANRTGKVGSATLAEPSAVAAPAAKPDLATARRNALTALGAQPSPRAAASPSVAQLPNATNAPVIATENARRVQSAQTGAASKQHQLADVYNDSLDKINELQARVNLLQDASKFPADIKLDDGSTYMRRSTSMRAQELSEVLTQLDAEKQVLEKRRRAMLGLQDPGVAASVPISAPPISNALGTVPSFGGAPSSFLPAMGPNWFNPAFGR